MSVYLPIPIAELPKSDAYDFGIYLAFNKKYVLYRKKNLPVDEGVLRELVEQGAEHIYIQQRDYTNYLRILYRGEVGGHFTGRYLLERFSPINARSLRVGSSPPLSIFSADSKGIPEPVLAPDMPGVPRAVGLRHREHFTRLYIMREDVGLFADFLNREWGREAKFDPLNPEGGILMRETAKLAAHGLYHGGDVAAGIVRAREAVGDIFRGMSSSPDVYYILLKVTDQDFNTYVHSVNLSVLGMGLGMEMDLSDDDVRNLGLGGMLHDIGKRRIDVGLLLKKDPLSADEYEKLKEHVSLGIEICRADASLPEAVVRLVAEHHERLDGSGYPGGLAGDELSLLGRMAAVIEVYDALATKQPYREAFSPFESMKMLREMGSILDQEIVSSFVHMLGKQKADV